MAYNVPGVYVEEKNSFPPSVVSVETAVPAFIGYTENHSGSSVIVKRIASLKEYSEEFGGGHEVNFTLSSGSAASFSAPDFRMYYALQLYFANGGGPCYIASVGTATGTLATSKLIDGINALDTYDEPTLLVFPDEMGLSDKGAVYQAAVQKCALLQDRFLLADAEDVDAQGGASSFRTEIGINDLKYAAAYTPYLETNFSYAADETNSTYDGNSLTSLNSAGANFNTQDYNAALAQIASIPVVLGPSAAMAGVYTKVDSARGVWKAPANVSLLAVRKPVTAFTDSQLAVLNVDTTGKSINAIRQFTGQGTLVWGARTLDGNSNEWRYISVRRFFMMVEESIQKATRRFVFEANDASTWEQVKTMVSNFLSLQWRNGALMGASPEDAFFVNVGLGATMTQQDILNGRMIIEIGMAAVRPAEFIILRFSHKMMDA